MDDTPDDKTPPLEPTNPLAEMVKRLDADLAAAGIKVTTAAPPSSSKMRVTFIPARRENGAPITDPTDWLNYDKVAMLVDKLRDAKCVCPQHEEWMAMWRLLPERPDGTKPGAPPPAAAWPLWHTADRYMMFVGHLLYAVENEAIDKVYDYLESLSLQQWVATQG
jgi:hypothetical protein